MITIPQIKAARAMLGYSQQELADKARISIATLNNIERGAQTDPKLSTLRAIRNALEDGGIEFTNESDGGMGVRLIPASRETGCATILIIDDNQADRLVYKRWLKTISEGNYSVIEAEDARAGYESFVEHTPHCIILDFKMYGIDGFQLIVELKKDYPAIPPIIFVTGMHDQSLEERVRQQGVHAYLDKTMLNQEQLQSAVTSALKVA